MGVGTIRVDIKTIDDFRLALIPLVQQATDALGGLTDMQPPRLGTFDDAVLTAEHHQVLRADFMARLQQLAWDLVAVRNAQETAVADYQEDLRAAPDAVAAVVATLPAEAVPATRPDAPTPETAVLR